MGDVTMNDLTHKYGIAVMGGLAMLTFIVIVFA